MQPMPESKKIEDIKNHWSYGYHDVDYGHITNLALSFDENFLFSVGADSNIFGLLFNTTHETFEKIKSMKMKLTSKVRRDIIHLTLW